MDRSFRLTVLHGLRACMPTETEEEILSLSARLCR
ncbi:hypothetical protein AVEN_162559-1, partial [Araneus ventricosus]